MLTADCTIEHVMRRNERKIVDFGTQAGIQVAVGDLVSILTNFAG
jgi:hypothetical protein